MRLPKGRDRPGNPFYALDTKNLFGFLEGADVGEKGDRSLEFETTGSFGRGQGVYNSVEQEFIFSENALTDSFGLELGAHVLGQDIRRASDLPDFVGVNFMGVSAEFPLRCCLASDKRCSDPNHADGASQNTIPSRRLASRPMISPRRSSRHC